MEDKKIKMFLMILIAITALQSVTGFITLYAGIYAKDFNKIKADEMLNIIKQTDKNYYYKIFDPEDKSYMDDFKKNYTKKGNKTAVVTGIIIIIFSVFYTVPIVILFMKKKEGNGLEEIIDDSKKDETF